MLKGKFPDETKAIDKYYELVKKACSSIYGGVLIKSLPLPLARILTRTGLYRLLDRGCSKWAKKSVQQVLNKLTDNKDLQAALAYNWGDYGVEPSRASFLMQAILANHYLNGACYPNGGPSNIAKKMIQSITDCDGQVLVSARVKRIMIDEESGKATGVEMMDGNTIESDVVVSDAGLINTVTKLLPPDLVDIDFAADDRVGDDRLHTGATGINLFVGLKGNRQSFNLPKCQYWIHPSNDLVGTVDKHKALSLDEALNLKPEEIAPIFVGVPANKDKAWDDEHPDKTTLEIITLGPWNWFEKFMAFDKATKSHGPEYEKVKDVFAEKMWSRVSAVGCNGE